VGVEDERKGEREKGAYEGREGGEGKILSVSGKLIGIKEKIAKLNQKRKK
jgi:hypothetical protein